MFFNLSPVDRELKIKDISKLNQKEIGMSPAEKERAGHNHFRTFIYFMKLCLNFKKVKENYCDVGFWFLVCTMEKAR